MKIAITGSKGFIGSHLVEQLSTDYDVEEWDWKVGCECSEFNSQADYVIHLAGVTDVHESVDHPEFYWKQNAETTQHIQNWCYYTHTPLIYASSSCAKEWWRTPYGTSKRANELTAQRSQVGLRLTNVFGPGMKDTTLVSRIINNHISYISPHSRDFVHVSDVCDLIETIMLHDIRLLQPIYEVGSGVSIAVADLLSESQKKQVTQQLGATYEMQDNCANIDRTKELGWNPVHNIKDFIEENR